MDNNYAGVNSIATISGNNDKYNNKEQYSEEEDENGDEDDEDEEEDLGYNSLTQMKLKEDSKKTFI